MTDHLTNCGGEPISIPCTLNIELFCLRRVTHTPRVDSNEDNCPLGRLESDVLQSQLPQQRSLVSTEPWPVSFSLFPSGSDTLNQMSIDIDIVNRLQID